MIKIAGVFLLALLMTSAMNAQPNRQGNRGMANGERSGAVTRLDLSEAQSEEITKLRTELYTSMKPLKAKMAELRARERTLLSEESVDLKAVDKVIDEQSDLTNKMRKEQVRHQVAMNNVLSDEQQMKLEQGRRHSVRMGQAPKGRGAGSGTGYNRGYGRDHGRSGRSS